MIDDKDCFTNLPDASGKLNVFIPCVRSIAPIFWQFEVKKGWRIDSWVNELKEGTTVWFQ